MSAGVRSVLRAIEILELLEKRQRLTVAQIAQEMEIPVASAYQIIATLTSKRMVARVPVSGEHELGSGLFGLGNAARANLDVVRVSAPHLRLLHQLLDETIHLTALRGDELVYVDCVESTKRLRTHSSIGEIAELHCTAVGKAVLACCAEAERERLVGHHELKRFTDNTIVDRKELVRELEITARRGYSVDNVEHEEGVRCLGACLKNHEGFAVGSVSISGPSGRITVAGESEIARELVRTAHAISRELGCQT